MLVGRKMLRVNMERQYTTRVQRCLCDSFQGPACGSGWHQKGRQQANANLGVAGQKREKPKDFTEFSIDTQNAGA
jgi:hypothetical protein